MQLTLCKIKFKKVRAFLIATVIHSLPKKLQLHTYEAYEGNGNLIGKRVMKVGMESE